MPKDMHELIRITALAERPERLAVLPAVVPVLDELRAAGMGEVAGRLRRPRG